MAANLDFEYGNIRLIAARHGHFLYNKNDLFVGRSLETYGEWCEPAVSFLLKCLSPNQTILDVGANIGTFTVPFANAVGPGGAVYAFEPQRHVFHQLCANLALNQINQVRPRQMGVGRTNMQISVPMLDHNAEQNFGALGLADAKAGDDVEMICIDSLDLKACRLIKIDVEGMEAEVIAGAVETIRKLRPLLFVENNDIDRSGALIQTVLAQGYKAWWIITNYYNPQNQFGEHENIFSDIAPAADMFCAPKEMQTDIRGLEPVQGPEDHWKAAADRIVARQTR